MIGDWMEWAASLDRFSAFVLGVSVFGGLFGVGSIIATAIAFVRWRRAGSPRSAPPGQSRVAAG